MATQADLILTGGKITTLANDGVTPAEAEALAVMGDRIVWVGSSSQHEHLVGPSTRIIELADHRVIPGLIDPHIHFVRAGWTWNDEIRWGTADTLAEALALISTAAATRPPGTWIRVIGGWHPSQFAESRHPTIEELNAIAPDHPVIVQFLYEWAILNEAARRLIDWERAETDGANLADIDFDELGTPIGRVRGMPALRWLYSQLPVPSFEEQVKSTAAASRELLSFGITGVIDGGGSNTDPDKYDAIYETWRRGELGIRVRLTVHAGGPGLEEEQIGNYLRYAHARQGDSVLSLLAIGEEIVYAASDSFARLPDLSDTQIGRLRAIFRQCALKGWTVQVHSIRREKIEAILRLWEEIHDEVGIDKLRWAIVHGTTVTAEDARVLKKLGAGLLSEALLRLEGEEVVGYWGADALKQAPPIRDLRAAGVPVAVGSDALRVASYNPFSTLHWLLTGQTVAGHQIWSPDARLDRLEALEVVTSDAAWFSFEEHERGRLQPGYLADVAVLSDDYFEVELDRMTSLRSMLTMVGGRTVWSAPGFTGSPE